MTAPVSRRTFLAGASAAALAASMPLPGTVPPATAATAPVGKAWIVGTPGEFDGQHVIADSAEEAYRIWVEQQFDYDPREDDDTDEDDEFFDAHEYASRVPEWDGRAVADVTPADWFEVGYGYTCARCGGGCDQDCGTVVGDKVVCDLCVTNGEKATAATEARR